MGGRLSGEPQENLRGDWLQQTERELTLSAEPDVLFTGRICAGRARACTHCTADQCALAAAGETSDQGACASAAADQSQVALVMISALHENAGSLNRNLLSVDLYRRQRQAQI